MEEEKCRRPSLYTRSKSAWRKSLALRGKAALPPRGKTPRFDSPDTLAVTVTQIPDRFVTADARCLLRATGLFAETWLHRNPLAPLGAAARQNLLAALGLHARAKSVLLGSLAPIRLECTLGHEKYRLLIRSTVLGQTVSINHAPLSHQTPSLPIPTEFNRTDAACCVSLVACSLAANRHTLPASCTFSAAVTIAALDSAYASGMNNLSRKNSSRTFPHNKKICASMPH